MRQRKTGDPAPIQFFEVAQHAFFAGVIAAQTVRALNGMHCGNRTRAFRLSQNRFEFH